MVNDLKSKSAEPDMFFSTSVLKIVWKNYGECQAEIF